MKYPATPSCDDIRYGRYSGDLPNFAFGDCGRFVTCQLKDSKLTGASFAGVWLENSSFVRCDFGRADLSGVADHGNLFRDCQFVGARFDHANLGYEGSRYQACHFERASFRKSAFARPQFESCSFDRCRLADVDFEAASFNDCRFVGPLRNVWFRKGYSHPALADEFGPAPGNRMLGVDFSQATLWGVTFGGGLDLSTVIPPDDGRHHLYDRWRQRFHAVKAGLARVQPEAQQGVETFVRVFEPSSTEQDYYVINEADLDNIFGEPARREIIGLLEP